MIHYKLVRRLSGHFNTVLSCCFSPDGALIATASCDTRVIVWDHATGQQVRVFHHLYPPPGIIYMSGDNSSHVRCVAFSPSGCQLASICDDG
ncbi:WD repeat and SOCS box-containing protein 1 [Portunus trituberculatus]|uniref:WD repeat and SOCS box-containing protein 1 n=1 Tax=Portunus trituberculatus TaxID=210409 RepID=A0A5B7JIH9_PORTR|nr:WD repeat and SOCS box-containing protein 1 [Portunus trituberculatus]